MKRILHIILKAYLIYFTSKLLRLYLYTRTVVYCGLQIHGLANVNLYKIYISIVIYIELMN